MSYLKILKYLIMILRIQKFDISSSIWQVGETGTELG